MSGRRNEEGKLSSKRLHRAAEWGKEFGTKADLVLILDFSFIICEVLGRSLNLRLRYLICKI